MGNLKVNPQTREVLNEAGEVVGTLAKDAETHPNVVAQDIDKTVAFVKSNSMNTRTLEKLVVYGAGLVAATNGFAQLSMPNNIRAALLGASSIVLLAIHHSSTKN